MTLETMISRVRKRSRTPDDFVDDQEVEDKIDEAVKKFAKDVNGLIKHTYLALAPKFTTVTHMAVGLTITGGANALAATDVAITSTARSGVAGAQVATDLQTAIQAVGAATATVTFSTTTWIFTIDAGDSTSIEVGSPAGITYADATDLLFGTSGEQTGTTWESDIPRDCTVEIDLPSDFIRVKAVEWDRNPLMPATFDLFVSPQANGRPFCYHVHNKVMRVYYVPTSQKLLHVYYNYLPELSTRQTDLEIDDETEDAVLYYATALMYEDAGDEKRGVYYKAMYRDAKNVYKQQHSNQNPKYRMGDKAVTRNWTVIT